jgi:hypothetical protein
MIGFFLGLSPWWLWGALGAVVAVVGGLFALAPQRLSVRTLAALAAIAGLIVVLILFRSALGTAKAAGVAQERATWQALAAEYKALKVQAAIDAEATRQDSLDRIDAATDAHMEKSRTYYAARPSQRDAVVFDADRVRQIRAARAAIAAAAIGDPGSAANPGAGHAGSPQGRLDEGTGG